MSAKKLDARSGGRPEARARLRVAEKYREVAELIATEDGPAINVCVGLAVLAGIAAGDAICLTSIGERYSGSDHAAAAELLSRVDKNLGSHLRRLVEFKPTSHYGERLLRSTDRVVALRAAATLTDAARMRLI